MEAVKFLDEGAGTIGGLAIPYGGPNAGKDLHGEFFSSETDFALNWFTQRPILLDHGLGKKLGPELLGLQTKAEVTEAGVWAEGILDRSHRYWNVMKELVNKGALQFSSSAIPHLIIKETTGHIKRWPWAELSLTPEPANPLAIAAMKSLTGELERLPASAADMWGQLQARIEEIQQSRPAGTDSADSTKAAFTDGMLERFVLVEAMLKTFNPSETVERMARMEETYFQLSGRVYDIESEKGTLKSLTEKATAENDAVAQAAEIAYYHSLVGA